MQRRHRVFRKIGCRHAAFGGVAGEEIAGEFGHVLAPFRQRWQPHRHDVQAVIKILAEAAGGDFSGQIATGGRNHPHVHPHPARTAHTLEHLFGEHAQDLGLGRHRHVGYVIQEQGTAMRLFEQAGADILAALLHPEQRLFHPLRRHPRGRNHDERRIDARAPLVQQAGGDFLAGTGRAADQHAAAGGGHPLQCGAHLVDLRARAGQLDINAHPLLQRLIFAAQALGFSGAAHHQQQLFGLERLFDIIIGAALDGGDRGIKVAVPGNHHDRQGRIARFHGVQQLDPVHATALQPDIENDKAGPAFGQRHECAFGMGSGAGFKALIAQHAGHQLADIGFIVDDQDIKGHCGAVLLRRRWWRQPAGADRVAVRRQGAG